MAAVTRRHPQLRQWLRAAAMALGTAWVLTAMSFTPNAAVWIVATAAGALTLVSPMFGILVAIVAMTIPVMSSQFLFGLVFLVVGIAALRYLGSNDGRVFLIFLLAFVGAEFGPIWAAVALAGYMLGSSEGAVTAALACLALQVAGLMMGVDHLGVLATGGSSPGYVSFAELPEGLFTFGWVGEAISSIDTDPLVETITGIQSIPLFLLQPVLWGAGAGVAGSLRSSPDNPLRPAWGVVAVAAGVGATAIASGIALTLLDGPDIGTNLLGVALSSAVLAGAVVAVRELAFPPVLVQETAAAPSSMRAEDADVDELLRLIATAEDKLATSHTTHSVVMITDMKSFSAMTEEEGSVASAKLVQRHRDLLIPVITEHGGSGKSTGGDGLLAAFSSPKKALRCSVAMQKALQQHNRDHPDERDISVRVGIAAGDVVLDTGGRPFIGQALNLAARVMNLADGGCIMVTREVADGARGVKTRLHSHGDFSLKNIAEPVEVIEVLWNDEQPPRAPQSA